MFVEKPLRDLPVIFIVDDDPAERFLMRTSLEDSGFEVKEAENALEALELFDQFRPDLMLLDVLMPVMDGFELCEKLRERPDLENFPIVLVTGLDDTASIDQAYEIGATDFITKPINVSILGHRVRYILRSSRAEAAAATAHKQLKDAIESFPAAFFLFDKDDRLTITNSKAVEDFHGAAEVLSSGTSYLDILRSLAESGLVELAQDDVDSWVSDQCVRRRNETARKFERHRSDDIWHHIIERRTSDGGVVELHIDITELKRREHALEQAKKKAELGERAKSDFLGHMSHELRTPLNAIMGFANVIKSEPHGPIGAPEYGEYLAEILNGTDVLVQKIDDILLMSKASSGELVPNEETVATKRAIESILTSLEPRVAGAEINVTTSMPSDLPSLMADPGLLRKMLVSLLDNAIKFTSKGGDIKVSAMVCSQGRLRISIEDSGVGIEPEEIPVILKSFTQVDGTLRKRHEGTGLGLPLAAAIAEAHQTTLNIDSAPGEGTTVSLEFPTERVGDYQPCSEALLRTG